jgi:hypothetical protein
MVSWRDRIMGWAVPLALLGVVLLSYGLWIPWWGLFGNDLPYLWYYHLLGPMGPGEFAAMDRPVSALFYAAATLLFGEHVWLYHVLLLLLRWLSSVLLWWVLRIVWPERNQEAMLAALLLAVYPGFRQNPVALEFILHLVVLDLFLVSLGATLLSACHPRHRITLGIVSAVGAAGLFSLEYFIGLEILRPIFLWIITRRQGLAGRRQWKQILLAWLPALVVVILFLFWRNGIVSPPRHTRSLDGYRQRLAPGLERACRTAPDSGFCSAGVGRNGWDDILILVIGEKTSVQSSAGLHLSQTLAEAILGGNFNRYWSVVYAGWRFGFLADRH